MTRVCIPAPPHATMLSLLPTEKRAWRQRHGDYPSYGDARRRHHCSRLLSSRLWAGSGRGRTIHSMTALRPMSPFSEVARPPQTGRTIGGRLWPPWETTYAMEPQRERLARLVGAHNSTEELMLSGGKRRNRFSPSRAARVIANGSPSSVTRVPAKENGCRGNGAWAGCNFSSQLRGTLRDG
jgi:hypothetical protein